MTTAIAFVTGFAFGVFVMCVFVLAKNRDQPFEQDMTGGSDGHTEGVRSVENERA